MNVIWKVLIGVAIKCLAETNVTTPSVAATTVAAYSSSSDIARAVSAVGVSTEELCSSRSEQDVNKRINNALKNVFIAYSLVFRTGAWESIVIYFIYLCKSTASGENL